MILVRNDNSLLLILNQRRLLNSIASNLQKSVLLPIPIVKQDTSPLLAPQIELPLLNSLLLLLCRMLIARLFDFESKFASVALSADGQIISWMIGSWIDLAALDWASRIGFHGIRFILIRKLLLLLNLIFRSILDLHLRFELF